MDIIDFTIIDALMWSNYYWDILIYILILFLLLNQICKVATVVK